MEMQPTTRKYWYLVGACLTIAGSFLPWQTGGDPFPHWQPGIGMRHWNLAAWLRGDYEFPLEDNGGVLIVLVSLILLLLVYGKVHFVRTPHRWVLVCAVSLVSLSLYHASAMLWRQLESGGIIGGPELGPGLVVVTAGSLLVLYVSASAYRRQSSSRDTAPPR